MTTQALPVSLAVSNTELTHVDPISNAPVDMITFVDMDTNMSFAVDSLFVEKEDGLKITGPYSTVVTFLANSSSKAPALDMDLLTEDNFDADFLNLAGLCAVHIALTQSQVDYATSGETKWSDNTTLCNTIGYKAEDLLNVDMNAPKWQPTYGHATDVERSINLLKQMLEFVDPLLSKNKRRYLVLPECPNIDNIDEWGTLASGENFDFSVAPANIWTENVMDELHGWSPHQVETIHNLQCHEALWGFGELQHHIIRVT
jgi:hypothetical protein